MIAVQRAVRVLSLGVLVPLAVLRLEAQEKRPAWPLSIDPAGATTGSVDERSLLLLQLSGRAPLIPTTIRSFSTRALDSLASWERPSPARVAASGARITWTRPVAATWFNSGLPSETDGVVWAGRGFTAAGSFGGLARVGPFSIALRPVAFIAQNAAFTPPLGAQPHQAPTPYQNVIDLPYRFGDKPYGRIDPGESWIQLDTRYVVTGFSTATQAWGPMHVFPLLLGPNAGGFPHVLAGTGLPWNIGIGQVSGRMAVGRLDPSAYAPVRAGDRRRLASELVASFTPRGLDGLELGGGRFFHRRWPASGLSADVLTIPLEGFLKDALVDKDGVNAIADNQLASVFFRLVVPRGGVEIYGEFLRDDHSYDANDFFGEPDHESAYALGLSRAWGAQSPGEPLSSITLEVVNGRLSKIARLREQTAMYTHNELLEGHTERGKLLGSPAAFGGSGYAIIWRRDHQMSGWGASLRSESLAQNAEGGLYNGAHVGFHAIEATRAQQTSAGEVLVAASTRIGWNAESGGTGVGLRFVFRPGRPR